jgi:hypothetical protein
VRLFSVTQRDKSPLAAIDSFGDVAAEDDPVLEYFLSTNAVQVIDEHKAYLVLGRKGTGKTAIVRYFTESHPGHLSKSLSLRGYPWSVHAERVDRGASEIEAYVSSWRYLIAVEIAALVLSDTRASNTSSAQPLRQFMQDNYGGADPLLSDVLRPTSLKLSKFSLQPSVMGNQLGSVSLERSAKDHQFGLEVNALAKSILDTALQVASELGLGQLSLHFDELDQGLSTLDMARSRMIVGLILASREIRREVAKFGAKINPIIYLRTDLWDELQFSDKNKISQTLTLNLGWDSNALLQLVDVRIRAKVGESTSWSDVVEPDLMRGSQTKWNHILSRTFLRPRDVIRFLNAALKEAKKRDQNAAGIKNIDIVNSREEYSSYLKAELDDEIGTHWPQWDEALKACSAISTLTFEREDFASEYERRRSTDNPVTTDRALSLLYRFSVIGYERRSGYGGTSWAFQYTDPEAGWNNSATRFKVHLGLKEYAKLRETRQ